MTDVERRAVQPRPPVRPSNPRGSVSVEPARRGNGRVTRARRRPDADEPPSVDELATQLEVTRERLAANVDALVDRVRPKALLEDAGTSLRGLVVDEQGNLRTRRLIEIGAGVAGAVAALWALRRLFHR